MRVANSISLGFSLLLPDGLVNPVQTRKADVWMLPAMLPQHPGIAKAMIQYRSRTMPAAVAHATADRLNGTKWVWESAFSGETATGGDCQEIHLQAGIVMAIRSYFRQTHDLVWLNETAWPMLINFVSFFESRSSVVGTNCVCVHFNATELEEINTCTAAGGTDLGCSQQVCTVVPHHVWTQGDNGKYEGCGICFCCMPDHPPSPINPDSTNCPAGTDCLSLKNVESPNEYAHGIDNDIYTNTAFVRCLVRNRCLYLVYLRMLLVLV
jgi:hypothetical protein